MSLDLCFLTPALGQRHDWDAALRELTPTRCASLQDEPLTPARRQLWLRVVSAVRPLVPAAGLRTTYCSAELDHLASGLQLTLSPRGLSLTACERAAGRPYTRPATAG